MWGRLGLAPSGRCLWRSCALLAPGRRRGTSAEQERRDGGPGHQARRVGALGRAVHRLVGPRVVGPGRPLKAVAPPCAPPSWPGPSSASGCPGPPRQWRCGPREGGGGRLPSARSFNPQYGDMQQLGAVDSMTVRSTEGRETLLKLALPAPQGSGNAAGRLTRRGRPAAARQLDDFLGPPRPRTLD